MYLNVYKAFLRTIQKHKYVVIGNVLVSKPCNMVGYCIFVYFQTRMTESIHLHCKIVTNWSDRAHYVMWNVPVQASLETVTVVHGARVCASRFMAQHYENLMFNRYIAVLHTYTEIIIIITKTVLYLLHVYIMQPSFEWQLHTKDQCFQTVSSLYVVPLYSLPVKKIWSERPELVKLL